MVASSSCLSSRIPRPVECLLGLLPLLLLVAPRAATAQGLFTNGRWVAQFPMRDPQAPADPLEVAIHMAALRGRADSTHVLYFNHGYSARLMLNAVDGAIARHVNVPSGSHTSPTYVESF